MKRMITFLINKWLLRDCPHCCAFCEFKEKEQVTCWNDLSEKLKRIN